MSIAFDRMRPDETPEAAARRLGVAPSHALQAKGILASLSMLLGPRFKDKLDRTRLPLSLAKQIASPVPTGLVNEVKTGRINEVTLLAWHGLRDDPPATYSELVDLGAGSLSRHYRAALKNLSAALRHFGHEPRSMPLDVALFVYREEVIARRLLPLYSQDYDASKVELWPHEVPSARLKGAHHVRRK
ncbi:MAG: hypothetical protein AB7U75_19910 [Hyphomicrobiaceae bacterium]